MLLTTFSDPLAALLQNKLHRLVQGEPHLLERLDVLALLRERGRLLLPGPAPAGTADQHGHRLNSTGSGMTRCPQDPHGLATRRQTAAHGHAPRPSGSKEELHPNFNTILINGVGGIRRLAVIAAR